MKVLIITVQDEEEQVVDNILSLLKTTPHKIKKTDLSSSDKVSISGLTIFPGLRKVLMNEKEILLTFHEFDLLFFLASHQRQVFTKEQIYKAVWDDIPISVDAKVICMISNVRHKLKAYSEKDYIYTVWGVGYKFDP